MSIQLKNSSDIFEVLRMPANLYKANLVDDKELCFNGKMYDIKSVHISGDSVKIVAINDVFEEKILEQIKGFIKIINNPHTEIPVHFKRILLLTYMFPAAHFKFDAPNFNFLNYYRTNTDYFLNISDTITPPPRTV